MPIFPLARTISMYFIIWYSTRYTWYFSDAVRSLYSAQNSFLQKTEREGEYSQWPFLY